MLFDLRGRGRRRTVQVIYGGLAVLIGLGLVGLGIGGGFGSGGILNSLTGNEGSNSASFSAQIDKYRKLTEKEPSNASAWEKLTLAQLHEAGGEAYVNASTGAVTSKGRELFAQASRSWERYLALSSSNPSIELAKLMLRVYGGEGLNQPASAVQILQLIVAHEPNSASYYAQLAAYAYKAKNTRIGDLATAKALALAPAAQRSQVKKQLAAIKANPNGTSETGSSQSAGTGGGAGGGSTATVPAQTATTATTSTTKK